MIVVDTGVLYAYVDRDDQFHRTSRDLLESYPGALVVPVLTITEAAHLMGTRLGPEPEIRFLGDLSSDAFVVDDVQPSDWSRIMELVARYRDFPLRTVDASVIACAERLGVTTVATIDRRHFSAVRPRHVDAFDLLP